MNSIGRQWIIMLCCFAFLTTAVRAVLAVVGLIDGNVTAFLAFPLTVILPGLAFAYVSQLEEMVSEEGTLMQLGVLIQLLLILALPSFALYLSLGFPVVFLVVELFETKAPEGFRTWIKRRILA